MVKKLDKVVSTITGVVSIFSFAALIGVMLLITVDVILRKVADITIVGSYEIVERMLLILVFAGFAYAQTNRSHIHVCMFISKMPKVLRRAIFGVLSLLSFIAAVLTGYALILQGNYALEAGTWTPVLYIPLYPFFYIAAIGMFIFALAILWDTIKSFIGIVNDEVGQDIESSWE